MERARCSPYCWYPEYFPVYHLPDNPTSTAVKCNSLGNRSKLLHDGDVRHRYRKHSSVILHILYSNLKCNTTCRRLRWATCNHWCWWSWDDTGWSSSTARKIQNCTADHCVKVAWKEKKPSKPRWPTSILRKKKTKKSKSREAPRGSYRYPSLTTASMIKAPLSRSLPTELESTTW